MLEFEKKYLSMGYKVIAGMDEVGRGPLAGPVCTACVVMPLDDDKIIHGVNDSKKLTASKREELDKLIRSVALSYNIELVSPAVIDEINILNATKLAMVNCVEKMSIKPDVVLIDYIAKPEFSFQYETIVKGDALSYSVACASILAKVYRDNLMKQYALDFPEYEFDKHKGYGTKLHIQKILEYGPSPIHRKSFIKNFKVK